MTAIFAGSKLSARSKVWACSGEAAIAVAAAASMIDERRVTGIPPLCVRGQAHDLGRAMLNALSGGRAMATFDRAGPRASIARADYISFQPVRAVVLTPLLA